MKKIYNRTAIAFFLALCAGAALAQEHGSADDAKKMVVGAIAHIKEVGAEKAFAEFSEGDKWKFKDVYLFCYQFTGTNVCHGANKALIGKNLIDMKTADGQPLIANMIGIAKSNGMGWIDYQWPHPVTKKIEGKKAYIQRIPGYEGFVGAGVYQ